MAKYVLLVFVVFSLTTSLAQNTKWSAALNYPISIGDDFGNGTSGLIDAELKYRFVNLQFVRIGAGINVGLYEGTIEFPTEVQAFQETNWMIQPKIFSEFNVPALGKLTPYVGLGYTLIATSFDNRVPIPVSRITEKDTKGSFNFNIGLAYDVTNQIFIQAQYDYLQNTNEILAFPGTIEVEQNLGFLKLGLGFRF